MSSHSAATHSTASSGEKVNDPCASIGPTQLKAIAWFFTIVIGGAFLVRLFWWIDGQLYTTGGEYLNIDKLRANRVAAAELGAAAVDPRTAE